MSYVLNGITLDVQSKAVKHGSKVLNEKNAIPDYLNYTGKPTTILQGMGKAMDTWELSGYINSTNYATLLGNYNLDSRIGMVVNNGPIQECIITELSYEDKLGAETFNWYSMTIKFTGIIA